ncbi:MAG: sigma 54-interacting transcriptional regulator [Verrucomicrobiota bacterium]|nr:sigma 54-interacting transcriptional regulator [Verrucomicrobiota bacterium]
MFSESKTADPILPPLDHEEALTRLLHNREEFYRTILESLGEGILITNEESRIIFVNSRLEEITGYSKEELTGTVSYKLLTPPTEWALMEARLKDRLLGKVDEYEHELCRKDGGKHWVTVKATPYLNAQGQIVGTIGAIRCIQHLKSLEAENQHLLEEIRGKFEGEIVGRSPALLKVMEQIKMVASTQATVLVLGESGTGKELVARAIHECSSRQSKPLVRVNCASIPRELFESEFFGHAKGAFTGAIKDRIGRFELANGGTLFLDEIGEIPLELQSKLLRVLQEGQFERVGEERTRSIDVRIIAATNRDLLLESKNGRFRSDLYYRLSVFPIQMPALRDRPEDIEPLAEHFVRQSSRKLGVPAPRFSRAQIRQLENYSWPGNVRELQNVLERAMILARGGVLRITLPDEQGQIEASPRSAATDIINLSDLKNREREIIISALQQTNGKVYGNNGAAAMLAMKPTTLMSKLQKYGLRRVKGNQGRPAVNSSPVHSQ